MEKKTSGDYLGIMVRRGFADPNLVDKPIPSLSVEVLFFFHNPNLSENKSDGLYNLILYFIWLSVGV